MDDNSVIECVVMHVIGHVISVAAERRGASRLPALRSPSDGTVE